MMKWKLASHATSLISRQQKSQIKVNIMPYHDGPPCLVPLTKRLDFFSQISQTCLLRLRKTKRMIRTNLGDLQRFFTDTTPWESLHMIMHTHIRLQNLRIIISKTQSCNLKQSICIGMHTTGFTIHYHRQIT